MPTNIPLIAGGPDLAQYEAAEVYDADGGIKNVPKTGVATDMNSLQLQPQQLFFLDSVAVSVYDAAAIALLAWTITIDGQPVFPWVNQRLPGGQYSAVNAIQRLIYAGRLLKIQGTIPASAPAGFDTVVRLSGFFLRPRGYSNPIPLAWGNPFP
jgi:hypothetical protein